MGKLVEDYTKEIKELTDNNKKKRKLLIYGRAFNEK